MTRLSGKTAERPLAGAVLCCTSVSPELRTRYADYACQMGAEHKLDLTSDVTHLVVGDTNTPKYKYVAKEREDVKVLRPEWVEAVRDCWMADKPVDLSALEAQFRVPTLAGLKICITGFDDLHFRAQLQKNVVENGGEYTGDLTKDVTHLIAARPEGKKYEYGVQWQKKVVSLQWYKDTLDRGMQLDETFYHPTRPITEQGVGAWKRLAKPQSPLGKRPRDEAPGLEPARKLRRTASARLGSQNENMWTDIVGGVGFETSRTSQPDLKTAKSMPTICNVAASFNAGSDPVLNRPAEGAPGDSGFLAGRVFGVYGFDEKKAEKLRDILGQHGGIILDSLDNLGSEAVANGQKLLLLAPHSLPIERIALMGPPADRFETVSELWLEWCMANKSFVSPKIYPLGTHVPEQKPEHFRDLVLNATGFHGLETLHISKMMALLGAKYEQMFTPTVSVLICKRSNLNHQKLDHAKQWGVPVVSESWAWACIKNNRKEPLEKYLLQQPDGSLKGKPSSRKAGNDDKQNQHMQPELMDDARKGYDQIPAKQARGSSSKPTSVNSASNLVHQLRKPGSDFQLHEDDSASVHTAPSRMRDLNTRTNGKKENGREDSSSSTGTADQPLKDVSPNSPKKPRMEITNKPKKSLFRSLDGHSGHPNYEPMAEHRTTSGNKISDQLGTSAHKLNGAIQDLLDIKAKAKLVSGANAEDPSRTRNLLDRALSNLSNASATSNMRHSRASSVDTMNTDGIGSEIAPGPSDGKSQEKEEGKSSRSLTGRAKSKLCGPMASSVELGDTGPYCEVFVEEEATPQLTQLVYEDPEESIMLREKLAEKRRQRSRLGQKEDDPRPTHQRETRKIRDDDILANVGWGAGRRTRHKDRTPPGLKEF